MSIYKDGKLIAGGRQCMPLLSFMWADHVLNDVSWLRADTFSWQSGSVYVAVYNHLSDDISGKSLQSETISGTTVQFYVADDGHKICPASEESNVTAIYAATGVAWYYILDTVNQRFKLPRTKFGVTGLRDTVGNYVPESLPNIKGTTQGFPKWSNNAVFSDTALLSGAFSLGTTGTGSGSAVNTSAASSQYNSFKTYDIFNAGSYSSTYQDSAPVQPQATQMYLYFYVGTFTQTALENTAGLNASLFNGKADIDFSNTSMIDYVVEKQDPNSGNNYTWYRKYASGWVEQGGLVRSNSSTDVNIVYPIAFADANYTLTIGLITTVDNAVGLQWSGAKSKSATGCVIRPESGINKDWHAEGIAAN